MTTTTAPAPDVTASQEGFVRRHRATVLIGLALVAAVGLAIVLGVGTQTTTPMDPANPGPDGTRALFTPCP